VQTQAIADHRIAPRAKFQIYWGRNLGIQPPKPSKFGILPINAPLIGDMSARFSRNSQHLYATTGNLYVFNLVAFGGQTTEL